MSERVLAKPGAASKVNVKPVRPEPIPTIEEFGGGSVRCMLAEVFLPRILV
jgi:hypothetical protein